MSTNWGYVCLNHEPNIESEHWFNHGDDHLEMLYVLERHGLWPNVVTEFDTEPAPIIFNGYPTTSPIWWLREHPKCNIALRNEYGETKTLWTGHVKSLIDSYKVRVHRTNMLLDYINNIMEVKNAT